MSQENVEIVRKGFLAPEERGRIENAAGSWPRVPMLSREHVSVHEQNPTRTVVDE